MIFIAAISPEITFKASIIITATLSHFGILSFFMVKKNKFKGETINKSVFQKQPKGCELPGPTGSFI